MLIIPSLSFFYVSLFPLVSLYTRVGSHETRGCGGTCCCWYCMSLIRVLSECFHPDVNITIYAFKSKFDRHGLKRLAITIQNIDIYRFIITKEAKLCCNVCIHICLSACIIQKCVHLQFSTAIFQNHRNCSQCCCSFDI